jgi:hypothetical protein
MTIYFPHAACTRMGSFRRSWVVLELTAENWDRSGVLYRNEESEVVYGTIIRGEDGGSTRWMIQCHVHRDGRLKSAPGGRHATLEVAIEVLNTEVAASLIGCGPLPEDEWPVDADSPWIICSVSRGRTP